MNEKKKNKKNNKKNNKKRTRRAERRARRTRRRRRERRKGRKRAKLTDGDPSGHLACGDPSRKKVLKDRLGNRLGDVLKGQNAQVSHDVTFYLFIFFVRSGICDKITNLHVAAAAVVFVCVCLCVRFCGRLNCVAGDGRDALGENQSRCHS